MTKPSERIDELAREAALVHIGRDASLGERLSYSRCAETRIEAIVRYLNEFVESEHQLLHEEQKLKEKAEDELDECHQWLNEYGVGGKGEPLLRRISLMADMAHEKLENENLGEGEAAQYNCPSRDVLELRRQLAMSREHTAHYKERLDAKAGELAEMQAHAEQLNGVIAEKEKMLGKLEDNVESKHYAMLAAHEQLDAANKGYTQVQAELDKAREDLERHRKNEEWLHDKLTEMDLERARAKNAEKLTDEEFGKELVRRLNTLDDDEKEAFLDLMKHQVPMTEGLHMSVDRFLQRLGGATRRGVPSISPVFDEHGFSHFEWLTL